MTSVLLADDHPMIQSAVDVLLAGTRFALVGQARSSAQALTLIERLRPDLVLLDVQMGDGSGIELLRRLREARDERRVILLTAGVTDQELLAAFDLGVSGIVLKNADPACLIDCLEAVEAGGEWIDPEISARAKELREKAAHLPTLTPRERQLVSLIRKGLKNRDIASELGVTEGTIKVYLHALFDKFGVSNRTELAMRAEEFAVR